MSRVTIPKKRAGRPANPVEDADGQDIRDLGRNPVEYAVINGKREAVRWLYYVIGTRPRVSLGTNRERAIQRLAEWKTANRPDLLTVYQEPSDQPAPRLAFINGELMVKTSVEATAFWETLRQLTRDNPPIR